MHTYMHIKCVCFTVPHKFFAFLVCLSVDMAQRTNCFTVAFKFYYDVISSYIYCCQSSSLLTFLLTYLQSTNIHIDIQTYTPIILLEQHIRQEYMLLEQLVISSYYDVISSYIYCCQSSLLLTYALTHAYIRTEIYLHTHTYTNI